MTDIEMVEQIREMRLQLAELIRLVQPFYEILVPQKAVTAAKGLHRNTISLNDRVDKYRAEGVVGVLIPVQKSRICKARKKRKTNINKKEE